MARLSNGDIQAARDAYEAAASSRESGEPQTLSDGPGTHPRRLTHHPATDTMPSFSSRGDRVAFTSLRDDDYEIYLLELNEDGTPGPLERLTHSPGRDMHHRMGNRSPSYG